MAAQHSGGLVAASRFEPQKWAYHETRAQKIPLATARDLGQLLVRMFEDPPQYGTQGTG
jgi:hypothetical protein